MYIDTNLSYYSLNDETTEDAMTIHYTIWQRLFSRDVNPVLFILWSYTSWSRRIIKGV